MHFVEKKSFWEHTCLGKHWKRINSPSESEMTDSEPLHMTENGARPLPPPHFQVPLLRSAALRLLDKLIFLADLYCPLLWCKEFLMMRRCQRCWSPHAIILQNAERRRTALMLGGGPTRQDEHLLMTRIPGRVWTGVVMQKETLLVGGVGSTNRLFIDPVICSVHSNNSSVYLPTTLP